MNQQYITKVINTAFGIGTHEPTSWVQIDYQRIGTCKHCEEKITSDWFEDDDKGCGWSAWRGAKNCLIPPK